MDKPIFELKNWQLQNYPDWTGISGNVYGNPKFAEGFWINTSCIEQVEADDVSFLMHTHNSIYRCRFDCRGRDAGEGFEELELLKRMGVGFEELELLKRMGVGEEKAQAVMRAMERAVRNSRRRREEELLARIPAEENAVILDLTAEDEYYFRAVEVKKGGEHQFSEARNIHVGQAQDSVFIGNPYGDADSILANISFHYLPHAGSRIEFTEWTGDCGTVYVNNSGHSPLEVDTPFGRFTVPGGCCYPITPEAKGGRLSDPVPADTGEIWNTQIDGAEFRSRL